MKEVAPYFFKSICSEGAGITKGFEAASYPYPILIGYAASDPEQTYLLTKAMYDLYPDYKDSAPGSRGWALDKQVFDWVIPFHEGAVRYYREVGKWTPAIQAHNEKLLARENVLVTAWKAYLPSAPADREAFDKGWMSARATALDKAGLPPIWREW